MPLTDSPRVGPGERPAVLVVDLVRGFTEPGPPFGADLSSEVEAAARLCSAARSARAPVVFTTVGYDEDVEAQIGPWAIKAPGNAGLRAGSAAVEVDPRLGRDGDDTLIVKNFASAFFGTDLAERLSAAGVDTLLVAGTSTSGCVRATVVDGLQHRLRVLVVREAVGDRDRAAGEQSLLDLDRKYADVVSIDEALEVVA
jgi:maleamate amidohydrolase